jgi:hypothetical protein
MCHSVPARLHKQLSSPVFRVFFFETNRLTSRELRRRTPTICHFVARASSEDSTNCGRIAVSQDTALRDADHRLPS